MKTLKLLPVIVLLAFSLVPAKSFGLEQVFRVSDGKLVAFDQMIEDIKGAELVFVGEVHSNVKHHKAQLKIIKALNESKIPTAIGVEMFRAGSQKELDQWVEGTMSLGVFVGVYNANWGMPWPWYMNIFKYARQYGIPVIGLNLPDEITEKVARHGFEALTGDELKQLPPQMGFDIDDGYRAHVKKAFEAHGGTDKSFDNFCKAQMIWDKTMAYHLMTFLKRNPGKTVVVLAGAEHSAKKGIPDQIKKQSQHRYKVILPEQSGLFERNTTTTADADYLMPE
jgi:uncharacterized iron-regulated protein